MYQATLTIPSQSMCEVRIEYASVREPHHESYEKQNISAFVMRSVSDFRDIVMPKILGGRELRRAWSILRSSTSLQTIAVIVLAAGAGLIALSWKFLKQREIRQGQKEE
jgi:hypothetical protein